LSLSFIRLKLESCCAMNGYNNRHFQRFLMSDGASIISGLGGDMRSSAGRQRDRSRSPMDSTVTSSRQHQSLRSMWWRPDRLRTEGAHGGSGGRARLSSIISGGGGAGASLSSRYNPHRAGPSVGRQLRSPSGVVGGRGGYAVRRQFRLSDTSTSSSSSSSSLSGSSQRQRSGQSSSGGSSVGSYYSGSGSVVSRLSQRNVSVISSGSSVSSVSSVSSYNGAAPAAAVPGPLAIVGPSSEFVVPSPPPRPAPSRIRSMAPQASSSRSIAQSTPPRSASNLNYRHGQQPVALMRQRSSSSRVNIAFLRQDTSSCFGLSPFSNSSQRHELSASDLQFEAFKEQMLEEERQLELEWLRNNGRELERQRERELYWERVDHYSNRDQKIEKLREAARQARQAGKCGSGYDMGWLDSRRGGASGGSGGGASSVVTRRSISSRVSRSGRRKFTFHEQSVVFDLKWSG
ncbi:hypothetical protein BOX15_Mlig015072g1, partial [Macrostomum lignano]